MIHITKVILIAAAMSLAVPGLCQSNLAPQPLQGQERVSGCCTYFCLAPLKNENDPEVFARDDETGEGLMRFDGRLHRLKLVTEKQVNKRKSKWSIGDKTHQLWSDSTIMVLVEFRITGFDEESHGFKGKVTVIQGNRRRSFPIWGASGC